MFLDVFISYPPFLIAQFIDIILHLAKVDKETLTSCPLPSPSPLPLPIVGEGGGAQKAGVGEGDQSCLFFENVVILKVTINPDQEAR